MNAPSPYLLALHFKYVSKVFTWWALMVLTGIGAPPTRHTTLVPIFLFMSLSLCHYPSVTVLVLLSVLNVPVIITLMTTGTFSRSIGKLFSELRSVSDNLLLHLCGAKLRNHCKISHYKNCDSAPWIINEPHLCKVTHYIFGQYHASIGWLEDGDYYLMHKI